MTTLTELTLGISRLNGCPNAAPVQSQSAPEPPESEFLFVSDAPVCCGACLTALLRDCTGISV